MPTTLLAVDDSATMRKVLEITFAGEDFRVVTADSADGALAKLKSESPAIVLADATLSGTTGYQLAASVKSQSPLTPVIVLASKQQPYDPGKGSAARVDDYIEKPFDTQQLIDKVKKLLGKPAAAEGPSRSTAMGVGGAAPRPPVAGPPGAIRVPANAAVRRTTPGVAMPAQSGTNTAIGLDASAARPEIRHASPASVASPVTVTRSPAPPPSARSVTPAVATPAAAAAAAIEGGDFGGKLAGLGLTAEQVSGVLALSREVVERVVWEVVPVLAETLIKEEIKRLTSD